MITDGADVCRGAVVRRTRKFGWLAALSALVSLSCTTRVPQSVPTATSVPAGLEGTWSVDAVLIDLQSTKTPYYQRDDERLRSKMISVNATRIVAATAEQDECRGPSAITQRMTAAELLRSTLPARGTASTAVTVSDYQFPLAADASVDVLWIVCRSGSFGPEPLTPPSGIDSKTRNSTGTWIVQLPGDRAAIRWYSQTILLLSRVN